MNTSLVAPAYERRYYDFASTSTSTPRQPSERTAIIAIDGQSIANSGRWPWPRDVQAKLIDQQAAAQAQTVVNTTVTKSLNPGPVDIRLNVGESVQIGELVIKTGEAALMMPQFYKRKDAKPAFASDSFYAL